MRLIYPLGDSVECYIGWKYCLKPFVSFVLPSVVPICLSVTTTFFNLEQKTLYKHNLGVSYLFLCSTINFFSSYLPSWPRLPPPSLPAHLLPLPGCAGTDMMGKMLKMQMLEDEDDLAYETEKKDTSSTSDAQPAWMRTLHTTACNWLQLMPQTVNPLKRTVENIKVMA